MGVVEVQRVFFLSDYAKKDFLARRQGIISLDVEYRW